MSAAGRTTTALVSVVCVGLLTGGAYVGIAALRSSGATAPAGAAPAPEATPTSPVAAAAPASAATAVPRPAPVQERRFAPAAPPQPTTTPARTATPAPTAPPEPTPKPTPKPTPTPEPTPKATPRPELVPGPPILQRGDDSERVRALQARLIQLGWFDRTPGTLFGPVTEAAVEGFQAKRGFPVTGQVDRRTMDRLAQMTHRPTRDEMYPPPPRPTSGGSSAGLDPRCRTGRVMCVDKTSDTLRWVVDGDVRMTMDVRFGRASMPTAEGYFSVQRMNRDGWSSTYDVAMPFAMTFYGGQAVHYSADFAAVGYDGASHGCVNVRDWDAIEALFAQVRVGDGVVVYRA